MGKGSSKSTTNTVAEPWKGVQPHLKTLADDVLSAYQGGGLDVAPYGGPRVGPQSGLTTGSQGAMASLLGREDPFLASGAQNMANLSAFMPQSWLTQAGQSGVGQTAMGFNPVRAGAMYGFGQAMQGPEGGLGGLDTAQAMMGEYTGQPGAGLDQVKENILSDVVPATSHLFGSSGMLDSSMAQDTVGRSAAEALAPFEYGAYESARDRGLSAMSQAAGMEQGAYEASRGRQMQGLGMSPDLMAARYIDPMMAMRAGGVTDDWMGRERDRQAGLLGEAGRLSAAQYLGPQAGAAAGQRQDAYQQAQADAAMQQHYEEQQRRMQELQRASSLLMGFGGLGGTSTATQQQPGPGVMGTIGDIAQVAAPFAMMAMSDRRVKTDIRRIGETAEGYPKYEFRYLWDAPGTLRIGVMADEVPPELVHEIGGVLHVDYSGVTF